MSEELVSGEAFHSSHAPTTREAVEAEIRWYVSPERSWREKANERGCHARNLEIRALHARVAELERERDELQDKYNRCVDFADNRLDEIAQRQHKELMASVDEVLAELRASGEQAPAAPGGEGE